MRMICASMLAGVLLIATPLAAQPPPPAAAAAAADPLVRENATRKLTDHVYAIPDFRTPLVPNVGIIVGSRATLVVDTGLGGRNGEAILREVAKVSRNRELYLVTTHVHPEHDLGAHVFAPPWKLIRSRDQERDIAAQGLRLANAFSQRSPLTAELLRGAEYRKADITFDTEHVIDLGGVRVRIMAMGLNHTLGDTAIFVEPDGVLFSGDVAMANQPSFTDQTSSIGHWLASLDRFDALKPKHVVGAHGDLGGPEIIAGYRTYFTQIRTRVGALKAQGKTQAEATQTITSEMQARYPDAGRLGGAIRAAWTLG